MSRSLLVVLVLACVALANLHTGAALPQREVAANALEPLSITEAAPKIQQSLESTKPKSLNKLQSRIGLQSQANVDAESEADANALVSTSVGVNDICGPDISTDLRTVIQDFNTFWPTIPQAQRDEMCNYLGPLDNILKGRSYKVAGIAWDIVEMYKGNYDALIGAKGVYAAGCAKSTGPCQYTVAVDGKCSYTGSVNYVIFGHMSRLCGKWKVTMEALIFGYKGNPIMGLSGNYKESLEWAKAGFDGWGLSGNKTPNPANDRGSCPVTCSAKSPGPFSVHMHPYHLKVASKKITPWGPGAATGRP